MREREDKTVRFAFDIICYLTYLLFEIIAVGDICYLTYERGDRDEEAFVKVTTQRDADRRIGERLGDEVAIICISHICRYISEIYRIHHIHRTYIYV